MLNCHRRGHFCKECRAPRRKEIKDNALIVQDGLGYDWSYIAQDEPTEFALMAYTSNSSGSDTENYMPPLADLSFTGLDDSVYRTTANKTSATVGAVKGNGVTVVKASTSCVWRPKQDDLNNGSKD
ncbi:hypothetical protein Tco_1437609 [Tanacetum coccineum]